jgi:hypothetical protein
MLGLRKNPVDGFSAGLVDDDNVYEWEVRVTHYADGNSLLSTFYLHRQITIFGYVLLHSVLILEAVFD